METRLGVLHLELSWAIVKRSEVKAESAAKNVRNEERKLAKFEDKVGGLVMVVGRYGIYWFNIIMGLSTQ